MSRIRVASYSATAGALYFLLARYGLRVSFGNVHASPVWPPAGIGLAALLLMGWRSWPGIWLGAFFANALATIQFEHAPAMVAGWVAAVIATGNTLEALVGWWWWQRWLGPFARFKRERGFPEVSEVFVFALIAFLACFASACIGTWAICKAGFAPWSQYGPIKVLWCVGDVSAVQLLTPLLVVWAWPVKLRWKFERAVEALAAFGMLAGSLLLVFGEMLWVKQVPYLPILPMVWIAVRQSPRVLSLALLLLASSCVWFTHQKLGPFVNSSEYETFLRLLLFLWTVALICMVLSSSVEARKKLEEELEERIAERTAQLKAAVDQEVLLRREINHRVKNNLQVIKSLLYLQSTSVKEPRLHDLLRESESRVMAMALIYDRLSHEGAVAGIAFHAYLRQLVTGLFQAYGVRPGRIELVAELEEVFLNLDTAVPCALIATELVSNAIKFAFPDEREGQVHIELHRDGGEGRFRLSVSDSGIGLPRGFDFEKATSTGMGLMRDLVRQLNGRIEFVTDPAQGTTAKVIFFQAGYSGALA